MDIDDNKQVQSPPVPELPELSGMFIIILESSNTLFTLYFFLLLY